MNRILSFIVGLAIALSLCTVAIAQDYREHVVAKGETASTIAQKYNITEAALLDANPALKNYCYVGMKLRIPSASAKTTVAESVSKQSVANNEGVTESEKSTKTSESSERYYLDASGDGRAANASGVVAPFNVIVDEVRYGFVSSDAFSLFFTIGANHFFDKSLYLGAQLGYGKASSSTSFESQKIVTSQHYIILPVELGYHLWLSKSRFDNWLSTGAGYAIVPYLGADVSYLVKATYKIGDQKESVKPDNRFGILAKVGAKLVLTQMYYLDAGYSFNNDGGYFFIGMGLMIPLCFGR